MTQAWPLYVVTSADFFSRERGKRESVKKKKEKKESLKKLCIWTVQNVLLISPQELEQIWKELCNVVGSL